MEAQMRLPYGHSMALAFEECLKSLFQTQKPMTIFQVIVKIATSAQA